MNGITKIIKIPHAGKADITFENVWIISNLKSDKFTPLMNYRIFLKQTSCKHSSLKTLKSKLRHLRSRCLVSCRQTYGYA